MCYQHNLASKSVCRAVYSTLANSTFLQFQCLGIDFQQVVSEEPSAGFASAPSTRQSGSVLNRIQGFRAIQTGLIGGGSAADSDFSVSARPRSFKGKRGASEKGSNPGPQVATDKNTRRAVFRKPWIPLALGSMSRLASPRLSSPRLSWLASRVCSAALARRRA